MQRVVVGLSGGVDSAVSAALLKRQGYEVIGAFIKIWQPEFIECTWQTDRLDTMRVCAALDIPFREVDLSGEYKEEVVSRMLSEYTAGRTPNPDVLCNRSIKFGSFAQWAYRQGAEYVATGHYARIGESSAGPTLLRGRDTEKDQSYFLHTLSQEDLRKILFPVGGVEKRKVRELAEEFNLPIAAKHDSQGLCFVGDVSMADFLSRYISLSQGAVLNTAGERIGTHDGAALYTIGQRHGFRITTADVSKVPQFVVRIDTEANTITVSPDKNTATRLKTNVRELHWIGEQPVLPFSCEAQTRYRETPVSVTLQKVGAEVEISFSQPHIFSAGQSIVFYVGEQCLGGGILK